MVLIVLALLFITRTSTVKRDGGQGIEEESGVYARWKSSRKRLMNGGIR
jgi:hypothetical protein